MGRTLISAIALACAVLTLGCTAVSSSFGHLAGTNDARLEYAVEPDPGTGKTLDPSLAAVGVKARLACAGLAADVEATGDGHLVVTVDAEAAGAADDLVTWRGGLRVFRADDSVTLAPPDTSGARPMSRGGAAGEERWWQGSGEAIARIVRDARLDSGHTVFSERVPGTGEWRTRVAALPPLAVLGLGDPSFTSIGAVDSGRRLALGFSDAGVALLDAVRARNAAQRVVIARGRVLVATLPIDEATMNPLVVPMGDDLPAYTRVYRLRLLLGSPLLPPLRRVAAAPVPPRWGVATACALLPFALSFAWLFFVRRFDRARPEPLWLVVATFALGGLAIVPAALAELAFGAISPWLDPGLATLGGQPRALPLAIGVFTLVVGGVEETAKYLAAWSLPRHRREFDEPVDGIIYGCAAALGFAAVENVKYFALGRMSGAVIAMRTFETVPAHMFFGALWGYAMGRKLVSRRARVLPLLAVASLAHGTFDAVVSTDGMQLLATLLVLVLGVAFVVMLRRSLRHGATEARGIHEEPAGGELPLSQLPRAYFRVGSGPAFYGSAAAMVLFAFALTVLGTAYEILHHRVGAVFVTLATTMLALFGLAAWATSATIPLDVAIDARGVTFAGGLTSWVTIRARSIARRRSRAWVVLSTAAGEQCLGPTNQAVADDILAAMRSVAGDPG
ncbi:MAG: PrsW family intramembrane metalloprotease [Polyangiaceae bacterium]